MSLHNTSPFLSISLSLQYFKYPTNMDLLQVALIVFVLWLLIITFYLIKINRFFVKLSLEVKKGNLIEVLERVISNEARNAGDLNHLEKELKKVTENALGSIQK